MLVIPFKHAGLALATGLGSCLNAWLLFVLLRKRAIYTPRAEWGKFLAKLLVAVSAMAAVLYFAAGTAQHWIDAAKSLRVLWLTGLVLLGAGVYFAALWLMGFRPRDFSRTEAK